MSDTNKCLFCGVDHDDLEHCAGDDIHTGTAYADDVQTKLEDIAYSESCTGECGLTPKGKLCAPCLAAEALNYAEKFLRNALAECERRMEDK